MNCSAFASDAAWRTSSSEASGLPYLILSAIEPVKERRLLTHESD